MKSDKYREFFTAGFLMGPNSMKLLEEMTGQYGEYLKGKRIMDLGCGQGITSLFAARELGAGQIFSVDLWTEATQMEKNFVEWGIDGNAFPIHADARALPFADGFFDGVISVDSYHYFGRAPGFFAEKIWPLIKKGGYFMMCVPGIKAEFVEGYPALMDEWAGEEKDYFHSCSWWEKTLCDGAEGIEWVKSFESREFDGAWNDWFDSGHEYALRDRDFIRRGLGKYLNFVNVIIKKA